MIIDAGQRSYAIRYGPIILFSLILFDTVTLQAQNNTPQKNPIVISGEVGTFGEWYNSTGNIQRRPGSSGRFFARPNLSLWDGKLNLRGDLLLSSEGEQTRQDINYYGFSADWAWGQVEAGDYSPSFTPLTANGITARGTSVLLNPGLFLLKFFNGQSQRGTYGDTNDREVNGLQIGIKHKNTDSHFLLQFVHANETAIKEKSTLDSLYFDPWASTTPQENLVASAHAQITLPKRLGRIYGELAGALHNQDKNAEQLNLEEIDIASVIPDFLTDLFTPTYSTHADYAYTIDSDLRLKVINLQLGHYYTGTGFNSLGVGSLLNDRKGYKGSISSNLFKRKLFMRLGLTTQENNLVKQKAITTIRNMINASLTYRFSMSTNAMFNMVWSNAEGDSITSNEFTYEGLHLSGALMSRLMLWDRNMSWQIMASHQGLKSSVGAKQFIDNFSQSLSLNVNAEISSTLSVVPTLSFIFPQGETTPGTMVVNGVSKLVYRLPSRKLRFSLGGSYGAKGTSSNTGIRASGNWRITNSDNLSLNFRHYFSRNSTIMKTNFNETVSNVSYTRRF